MARSTTPPVSVSRRRSTGGDPERTVVWMRGDHDTTTRVSMAVGIARAAQRDDGPLLVDLSGVAFMHASTIAAIVGSRDRLRSRAQSIELRAPSAPALRVLELCGLRHLVQPEPDRSCDAAPALASWVTVLPVTPPVNGDGSGEDSEVAVARVRGAADGRADEAAATIGSGHGGP